MRITTIGLDIAKNVFQVHGIDSAEKVVVRKQLRRGQVLKFTFGPSDRDDRYVRNLYSCRRVDRQAAGGCRQSNSTRGEAR
jgi:hypothetical protein